MHNVWNNVPSVMNEPWNCEMPQAKFFTCLSRLAFSHLEDPRSERYTKTGAHRPAPMLRKLTPPMATISRSGVGGGGGGEGVEGGWLAPVSVGAGGSTWCLFWVFYSFGIIILLTELCKEVGNNIHSSVSGHWVISPSCLLWIVLQ